MLYIVSQQVLLLRYFAITQNKNAKKFASPRSYLNLVIKFFHLNSMRKLIGFIYLIFCWCVSVNAQTDSLMQSKINNLVKNTRDLYAPDRRTVIFDLLFDPLYGFTLETSDTAAANHFRAMYFKAKINDPLRIKLLPDAALLDTVYGLVNVSVGNIRTLPKNAAEMASQALLGWQVDVLKKEEGYYLIRTPDGYIGWMDAAAINLKTRSELAEWNGRKKIIITADYGHVYSDQTPGALRVSDLVMGNILENEGLKGDFYQVLFPDGRRGYIEKKLAMDYNEWKSKLVPSASSILTTAKTMIGVPYLWGGTSIKGVDCSGFTKTAYFMNGFIIPRDASQQVLVGEALDILSNDTLDLAKALKNLKAGDLLFFAGGRHRDPKARITHVALYMGNGEFIHSAGKVRINSMLPEAPNYDDFQSRTLIAARRYLGYTGTTGIKQVE